RRHVDDDAAPRVGRFADAHDQYIARDPEVLERTCECEGPRRDDAVVALHVDERTVVEVLRVNDDTEHVSEHLVLVRHADVIPERRNTVADHSLTDLRRLERLDHAVFFRHSPYPPIAAYRHALSPG